MAKISIIIPVYQVEKYLPACLDSVVKQNFQDWEAICVDDGSPDNCGKILAEYAKKDRRIKVITQKNQGVSMARNHALTATTGDYVCFLDSDDELHPDFLEKMYDLITTTSSDIVSCDYRKTPFDNIKCFGHWRQPVESEFQADFQSDWQAQLGGNGDTSGVSRMVLHLSDENSHSDPQIYTSVFDCFLRRSPKIISAVWGKLYKKDILDNIRFPSQEIGEDLVFLYQALYQAKQGAYLPEKLYFYRRRENSATLGSFSEKKILDNIQTAVCWYHYFKDKELNPKTRRLLNKKIARQIFKPAVLEPKRQDPENVKKWYALSRPLLIELKQKGIYQSQYLSFKNRLISWFFLK